jgi:hypothetical protein
MRTSEIVILIVVGVIILSRFFVYFTLFKKDKKDKSL